MTVVLVINSGFGTYMFDVKYICFVRSHLYLLTQQVVVPIHI